MLQTPFGAVGIRLDGKELPYIAEPLPTDDRCSDLLGRFRITVRISPDADNPRDVQTWFGADPTLFRV